MDIETDWAEALRSFRQRNNLKQEAAASLLGVSQAYVSKVENGAVQPSEALLKRFALLNRQPEHRPTIGLYKAAVRHSPWLMCLFSLRDGKAFLEQASRAFFSAGHPFDQVGSTGFADFSIFDEEGAKAMKSLITAGAFEGKFGLIEVVWSSAPRKDHDAVYYRTVYSPLRTDQNEWLLQCSVVPISQTDMYKAIKSWGGPLRILEHDEDPHHDWP